MGQTTVAKDVRKEIDNIILEFKVQLENRAESEAKKKLIKLLDNIKVVNLFPDDRETVAFYEHPYIKFSALRLLETFNSYDYEFQTFKEYLTCILAHEISHSFDPIPKHRISGFDDIEKNSNSIGKDFFITKLNEELNLMENIDKKEIVELIKSAFVKSVISKYLSSEYRANKHGEILINTLFPTNESLKSCYEKFFNLRTKHEENIMNEYIWSFYDNNLNLDYELKQEFKPELSKILKDIITDYNGFNSYSY